MKSSLEEQPSSSARYRVDDLIVDTGRVEVTRAGLLVALPKLSFDLLVALIKGAPEVVTTDAVLNEVWRGLVVSPETLSQRVKLLRDALGDDSKNPRYILVVRGRGLRLIPVPELLPDRTAPEPSVPTPSVGSPRGSRVRAGWIAAVGSAIAIVVLIAVLWQHRSAGRVLNAPQVGTATPDKLPDRTIAVLPFQNLDPGGSFLGIGVSDSIRTRLGGEPRLDVISGNSSAAYSGVAADPKRIGHELNARYLLEGTLQQHAESIRITARLVDAETAADVWSVIFDRRSNDIFAVQDEIAMKVAQALRVTLRSADERHRGGVGTNNLDAYLEYAQARSLLASLKPSNIESSLEHFRAAGHLDPAFAAAYSGLADAYSKLGMWGTPKDPAQNEASMRAAIAKALELDPDNAEAYWVLADWEEDDTKQSAYIRRAVALQPNTARANFELAQSVDLAASQTSPDGVDARLMHLTKAMELDPLEPRYPRSIAWVYFAQRTGEIDKVEPFLLRSLEIDPGYLPSLTTLGEFRAVIHGQYAEAVKMAEDSLRQQPDSDREKDSLAHMYLASGDVAAVDNVVAQSKSPNSRILSLVAHQQYKEAATLYDEDRKLPDQADIGVALFAVFMDAVESHQYTRGLKILGEESAIEWSSDGTPKVQIAMRTTMDDDVQYAYLLQLTGESERARRILEMTLASIDMTAVKFKRGDFWFLISRADALALLGRDEESMHCLEEAVNRGMNYDWWQTAISPVYARLRNNPRFQAYVSGQRRNADEQLKLIRQMRARGELVNRH